jgi:hypothetical protein
MSFDLVHGLQIVRVNCADAAGLCGVISEPERRSRDIAAIPAWSPEAREFVCH